MDIFVVYYIIDQENLNFSDNCNFYFAILMSLDRLQWHFLLILLNKERYESFSSNSILPAVIKISLPHGVM